MAEFGCTDLQGGQFQPTSGHQVLQYEQLSGWLLPEGKVSSQTKL